MARTICGHATQPVVSSHFSPGAAPQVGQRGEHLFWVEFLAPSQNLRGGNTSLLRLAAGLRRSHQAAHGFHELRIHLVRDDRYV